MKKETSSTVSFRLDPHYIGRLQSKAEKQGVSIHELARRTIVDDLDDRKGEELLAKVESLKQETAKIKDLEKAISDLRADLAEAVGWIVKRLSSEKK